MSTAVRAVKSESASREVRSSGSSGSGESGSEVAMDMITQAIPYTIALGGNTLISARMGRVYEYGALLLLNFASAHLI